MIRAQHDKNGVTIWRYDNLPNGDKEYWTHDGKHKIVRPGEPYPWWIVLGAEEVDNLIQVLADFATIRTPEYAYLEGELKATKLHLSDMRQLTMLTPPKGEPEDES